MAFERAPGNTVLDSAIAAELRDVLSRSLAKGAHGDELKGLLARAAADARTKGVQAEQLLVALKEVWYSLPQMTTSGGKDIQSQLLQQLIARSIQEYYGA